MAALYRIVGLAVTGLQLFGAQVRNDLYSLWHNEPLYRRTWYHIERQKRRLLEAYLSGVLELPELRRKRKELDGRSETLHAQKRQLEASANERMELAKIADTIERFCEQVRAGLTNATFEQKRALVELLIDQVVVTDEEVEIRYVVPTFPDGPHHPFCHLRTDYLDGFAGREVMGK